MAQNGDLPRLNRIYPSSSAFMVGPLVKSSSHNSCLRFVSAQCLSGLSKAELFHEITAEYAALGTLDEFRYSAKLKKEGKEFQREVPFQVEYKGAVISGRMDFLLDGLVIEKKSVTSQSIYKQVFEGGQPKTAWVAQVASYLAFLKIPAGKIVATYYELSEEFDAYQVVAEKEWDVQCLDSGCIIVNRVPFEHSLRDLARWYAEIEKTVSNPSAPQQKVCQPANKYESACNFCPIRSICDKGDDLAQHVQEIREKLLEKTPPKEFRIAINTKRRQDNREKKKVKD